MRCHPEIGARMIATTRPRRHQLLGPAPSRAPGRDVATPRARLAEDLPLEAAIVGVADAYEAMTRDRPHRSALEADAAAAELRTQAGSQFPPAVVEALLAAV